jgi:hypothetical protein
MAEHPMMIAGLVVAVMAVAGIVAAVLREMRLFDDFRDIAPGVKTIANELRADVFRDFEDLVVSGLYKGIPTVIRFTKREHSPAMGLYVRIPSPCQFSIVPKRLAGKAQTAVALRSRRLQADFVSKAANAKALESLLERDRNVRLLDALCCSQSTMLEVNTGRLELLEMEMPEELNRHVSDHLETIHEFSEVLSEMPGASEVKVVPLARQGSSLTVRLAVAACMVVMAISVIAATREHGIALVKAVSESAPINGVPADDANVIEDMNRWRATNPGEFETKFAEWLRDAGQQPASRIEFKPVTDGLSRGVAYLLAREDGARRLVVLIDHRPIYDAGFSRLDGIALVPTASFPKLKWGTPAQKAAGDAILIVRDANDPHSAELLFFPNGTLFTGVPKDYSAIDLQKPN